ncbi:hypothetical protein IBX38_04085 [Candidatus Bathyarchaeota archaeon]|nr:hypothetical protein [Candidatus Bathyarchaeota archaeon]
MCLGYIIWSPGAANYSVIAQSKEATRTVRIGDISITYPSVIICKAGEESSRTIEISNLDNDPKYVVVSLSLVRSSGVDSTTISALTGNPYRITLAAYGSVKDTLSFNPSSKGYAIFDITVNEKLAGSITLYVVSSP